MKQALTHQSNRTQPYYIPTPEAAQVVEDYATLYASTFKLGKSYVKLGAPVDDPLAQFPRYNADEADEAFIRGLREEHCLPASFTTTLFEWIMDCLEEAAHRLSEATVSTDSIERLRDKYAASLPDERTLGRIIEHWRERRRQLEHGRIPFLRHEDLGKIGADPYVCFRRRELKIPRKTRRSDAQIMDRLKKLHLELSSMRLMLQAATKRDRYKREALALEGELFERYRLVDNWRRHNKSTWPAQLPTFKSAAQSLLEAKKKKGYDRIGHDEEVTHVGGYKIAIPVAALKGSRHSRAYYPHDVGRLIQKDMEALLGSTQDEALSLTDELCGAAAAHGDRTLHGSPPLLPLELLDGRHGSFRRGRGGRIILDRSPRQMDFAVPGDLRSQHIPYVIQYQCRMPAAKEFASLQVALGNYNLHAVNTANQILRPMSYPAWLASTAPIVTALAGNSRPRSSPKKKRRVEEDTAGATNHATNGGDVGGNGAPPPPASPSPSLNDAPTVEISKLGNSNSQITVKLKALQSKETPRRGTGARFTPHGLAPDGVKEPTPVTAAAAAAAASAENSSK